MTSVSPPTVCAMVVTPSMAKDWLDHCNSNNRKVNPEHVRRLARDMSSGQWIPTHEGIAFDSDGIMLDGQHRLHAIVLSGMNIKLNVWRNVTRNSLMAIDCGKPRNICDIMRLSGKHDQLGHEQLAVLRAMLGGLSGPVKTMTVSEADSAFSNHADAIAFSIESLPRVKRVANAITRAVIARAYYSADHDRLRDFGQMLGTGVVPDRSAISIVLLRQFLTSSVGGSRIERTARYAKTQRSLMAFLRREPITRLLAANRELFPLPEEGDADS